MSDHSFVTPTQKRVDVQTGGAVDFPHIQGGRYEFLSVIGSGGSGTVFKARDTVLDKLVAIKKLHSFATDTSAVRFQREARLVGSLKHHNVMSALDFGLTTRNEPYLILDFVNGKSLSQLSRHEGPLAPADAIPLFIQICSGLSHAHQNNIIHRDLKPSNVMLVDEFDQLTGESTRVAKIVDFGLAKQLTDNDQVLTKTNVTLGTPIYMSPEQTRGAEVDRTTDIYSFGCLMFETLTGHPPFEADNNVELAELHRHTPPPNLANHNLDCSGHLEQIVARCLSKKPKDRYQSFVPIKNALELELESLDSSADRKTIELPIDSSALERKINWKLISGIAALLLTLLGASIWILRNAGNSRVDPAEMRVRLTDNGGLEKIVQGGKGGLRDKNGKLYSEGRWVCLDVNDDDLKLFLQKKPRVRDIDLSESTITARTFKALSKLKTIESLTYVSHAINDENLRNIAMIGTLKQIQIGGEADSPPDFDSLKHFDKLPMIDLQIHEVRLTPEAFKAIARFPKLQSLHFRECRGITPEGLSVLARLNKVEAINLEYTDVTDGGIKALSSNKGVLNRVVLSCCENLTPKSLGLMAGMKSLRYLDLRQIPNINQKSIDQFMTIRKDVELFTTTDSRGKRTPTVEL